MAYTQEKENAINLRKQGKSLNEIALQLGMNKSTVSYWCRNVELTSAQEQSLIKRSRLKGLKKMLKFFKEKKELRLKESRRQKNKGFSDVGSVKKRDLFMLGLALYWGEGYKKGNAECGFTNSDPLIIKTILCWFREIYRVTDDRFILRISIHNSHREREKDLISYWSKQTGISRKQFTKTSFITSRVKKIYSNRSMYFGTLRIKVRKGAFLRQRIVSSLEFVSSSIID